MVSWVAVCCPVMLGCCPDCSVALAMASCWAAYCSDQGSATLQFSIPTRNCAAVTPLHDALGAVAEGSGLPEEVRRPARAMLT